MKKKNVNWLLEILFAEKKVKDITLDAESSP